MDLTKTQFFFDKKQENKVNKVNVNIEQNSLLCTWYTDT